MVQGTLSEKLLNWFDREGRELPWRVKGGAHPDPYVILVSEIMLQQTQVKTVLPFFHKFMKRFPTVQDLANASQEEVYLYWQGLGYYSRARSLHATAKMIAEHYQGIFPSDKTEVLKLKGIGPYTAASFLSLAFNLPESVVDGNVVRIICRYYGLTEPVQEIMPEIREKAEALISFEHPADYTSAIMDLGATICTPKNPSCETCPWAEKCFARLNNKTEDIPVIKKLAKKEKTAKIYLISNAKGEIYIRKRGEKGLLANLYEFPWEEDGLINLSSTDLQKEVTHIFTHFKLVLKLHKVQSETPNLGGQFISVNDLKNFPFPTLMQKVWKAYLK
ncbi:MAG: A/G-specific adenine glycosylase [Alphaproteobacteria bacterium]|nr:A/G-specific adenine glycosylase [Alphaproteobacteria bacterium]